MTELHLLVRRELDAVVVDPADDHLPTRCAPWSVRDLYKHLSATFYRFNEMLRRARIGRMEAPFSPDELATENQRAIDGFPHDLDPRRSLCEQASRFLTMATNLDELMPHQLGPIAVTTQLRFGLAELAIHHDDVATARGASYRPSDEVAKAIAPAWEALGRGAPDSPDLWEWVLRTSGR